MKYAVMALLAMTFLSYGASLVDSAKENKLMRAVWVAALIWTGMSMYWLYASSGLF